MKCELSSSPGSELCVSKWRLRLRPHLARLTIRHVLVLDRGFDQQVVHSSNLHVVRLHDILYLSVPSLNWIEFESHVFSD